MVLSTLIAWRLGLSLSLLLALIAAEMLWPRRERALQRSRRWPGNLGIGLVGAAAVRFCVPLAAVGVAVLAAEKGWGLFQVLHLPALLAIPLSLLVLDLAIYAQHRLFHAVPLLWRVHRMHHSDLDLDATSALRFHPIELILSMLIKMAAVLALGAPPVAVVLFEIILNATAEFNHANLALPRGLDRALRMVLVTPDMHRVHHSVRRAETDSNFGFNLPWWDRLFGTYRAEPAEGHERMTLGLDDFREARDSGLLRLLRQPFLRLRNRARAGE